MVGAVGEVALRGLQACPLEKSLNLGEGSAFGQRWTYSKSLAGPLAVIMCDDGIAACQWPLHA